MTEKSMTTTLKRYSLARKYANNVGVPDIVEDPNGQYVRLDDHLRLLAACENHNQMLIALLKRAQGDSMKEYELHTQGARHTFEPEYDGNDPNRNKCAASAKLVDEPGNEIVQLLTSLELASHDYGYALAVGGDPSEAQERRAIAHRILISRYQALESAVREVLDTELGEMAWVGSDAPVERALGLLADAFVGRLQVDTACPHPPGSYQTDGFRPSEHPYKSALSAQSTAKKEVNTHE